MPRKKATLESRLKKTKNMISTPGKSCQHVSSDHPPVCMQPANTSCLVCPEHLNGLTDLLPWDKEELTETEIWVLSLYKRRNKLYFAMDYFYDEIHAITDELTTALEKLREERRCTKKN